MGTKKPSSAHFENTNTSERKLQPGGRICRDPSPRAAISVQSERERDGSRQETWRKERETEKTRDKARFKDVEPRDRHYERFYDTAPRTREGGRERWERERRQEDDRSINGRPLSNVERDSEREVERGKKKGDTFPGIRKHSADRGRRLKTTTEIDEEDGDKRQRDRPERVEPYYREKERERAWHGERYGERDGDQIQSRAKKEGQNPGRRPVDNEKSRQRERYQEFDGGFQDRGRELGDSHDRRERDVDRKRENQRLDMGKSEAMSPYPYRRRDKDVYSDRMEREKTQRGEGWRGTKSEGDCDEREVRKERKRDRKREELQYQHSRSEGEYTGKTKVERERDRTRYREEDRQRCMDSEREEDQARRRGVEKDREREFDRRAAKEADMEGDRWRQGVRDVKDERKEEERKRQCKQRRYRETKEREADPKGEESSVRGSRSLNERAPRVHQAQSSGEWSTTENDAEEQRYQERANERSQKEQKGSDRQEQGRGETTGSVPEERRMWLEPQRGKNSKDEIVDREGHTRKRSKDSHSEWRGDGQRVKEETDEKYLDQTSYREKIHEGRDVNRRSFESGTDGVNVDGEEEEGEFRRQMDMGRKENLPDSDGGIEESWQRKRKGENVTDNMEESDREEEGGSDYWARSESEGGSQTGFKQDRERVVSGEDGFVTVSSGGDEWEEREEYEEDEFEDCQEFWEVANDGPSPPTCSLHEGDKEREEGWKMKKEDVEEDREGVEKHPKYIYCVIGQKLPQTSSNEKTPLQDDKKHLKRDNSDLTSRQNHSDDATHKPGNDRHATLRRDDEHPTINNRTKDCKRESNMPSEQRAGIGGLTELDIRYRVLPEPQNAQPEEEMRQEKENPYAEIGPINRDSMTERLLIKWREINNELPQDMDQLFPGQSNSYEDVCSQLNFDQIQPILDGITTAVMSPEDVEAIRIRLSGAWSMLEEPKRHSQAPHLKWATDVVGEILGRSEDQAIDEPNAELLGDQSDAAIRCEKQQTEMEKTGETPVFKLRMDQQHSEPEIEEEEPLEEEKEEEEKEGLRGMEQSQAGMHVDQFTAMQGDTPSYIHADTLLDTEIHNMDKDTESSDHPYLEKVGIEETMNEEAGAVGELSKIQKELQREKEVEMFVSVSNTLYKPNSCPILYEAESELHIPSGEDEGQEVEDRIGDGDAQRQAVESEEVGTAGELGKTREKGGTEMNGREMLAENKITGNALTSTCSFRDLGPQARLRRRGIRKTAERRNGEHVEVEEEEGGGRDRRTRIFFTTDVEDDKSKSWGEVELRNVLDTQNKRKRNSRFFNAAQLYQQYSEAAQNFEILRQARSDAISVLEDTPRSPAPSPPPARRPLPPLPSIHHPHSLSHTSSITSVKSLPLPEPPRFEGRPSSPRLSISLTKSTTLWRELPGVRNSTELEELTEDQRRLQEVRFEVVTSEASYCRSLDIVVEHFVKSKQLGALLTSQDRNWLFSRLADVRAISHSFLSKLEERVESEIIHFSVCDIIARHCQRFKMIYVPYLTNQSYQDATYQRLMNENAGFKRIVENLERSSVCQRLPLRSFLVLPFQRITRLKLLVQNIVKRTTPGTSEATQAIKALKLLEKLIQESNDSITQMESIESLVSLSAKVDFECRTLPLISQSRRLVREGPVTELMDFSLKDTERNIYLHLFNDYLLLSLQKEGGKFTVIDHSPVSELRAENCRVKLHSLQKNLFRLHMSNKALLLRTDTQSDKLRWISALSRPHPEIDFSAAQDFTQMQCIRAFVGQQPDELSLEKADIILVHQQSSDHWIEGTRLSDRHRGWVPVSHLETITNSRVRQRNLSDALKLSTATANV